jgi:hypothetical protein
MKNLKIGDKVTNTDGEKLTVDEIFKNAQGDAVYLCNRSDGSYDFFEADELVKEKSSIYTHSITIDGTIAHVQINEITPNGAVREVARAYGHIIHDGAVGYAQAIGYAFDRIVKNLGGYPDLRKEKREWGECK